MNGLNSGCPFCRVPDRQVLAERERAFCIADRHPVMRGHSLVIPRRHVADFFELGAEEVAEIYELLVEMRGKLEQAYSPDGFNVGINVGGAAGQRVWHVHVHLIPRYAGEARRARGEVRNVILVEGEGVERREV